MRQANLKKQLLAAYLANFDQPQALTPTYPSEGIEQ
jgi:hypothetical protein